MTTDINKEVFPMRKLIVIASVIMLAGAASDWIMANVNLSSSA
jgi:hypothetical protein